MFCRKTPEPKPYFKAGDTERFTEIFNFYYARLCFFANRLLRNPEASEDIVSDVFITLWTVEIKFATDTTVKAWLYITTRNSCFNYIKRINKISPQEIEPNSVYSDETILVAITRAEILQEIMTLIDTLPIECRRIFKLSYFDGLTNNEIAEKLCLSIHTVKNQKARAIYLIRKGLRKIQHHHR